MKTIIVSLHDVHPGSWEQIRQQIDFLENLGIKRFSLLVVPHFHHEKEVAQCSQLVKWLQERQDAGDEIVLHGFYHQRSATSTRLADFFWTRIYTQNEAEFYDLDYAEAVKRLRLGKNFLAALGFHASGFIAPGWLLNPAAFKAIFEEGFQYTTTLKAIWVRGTSQSHCQSLCYSTRAGWRRMVSLIWNQNLWRNVSRNNIVRLSLHPNDLLYDSLRKQIGSLIQQSIRLGFQAVTYRDYTAKLIDPS